MSKTKWWQYALRVLIAPFVIVFAIIYAFFAGLKTIGKTSVLVLYDWFGG